jgi:inner membrane protein
VDPISQAFIGATAAQSVACRSPRAEGLAVDVKTSELLKRRMWLAMLAGVLGGMAADLDVFIRSANDPLLAIQFHRHFTHSLIFIPFGGITVGLLLFTFLKRFAPGFIGGLSWQQSVFFASIGFGTHGLLDACTSYGTQLLWPFSNLRVAWNNVGIIDPIPTLSWMVGSYMAAKRTDPRWARAGFLIAIVYLGFGVIQRDRAYEVQTQLLSERGHQATRRAVKPTILQLFVWKSVYEFNGRYFTDAIRVGFGSNKIYEGDKRGLAKFVLPQPNQDRGLSTLDNDLQRFHWFSDGWVARIHDREVDGQTILGDIRYSMLPQEIDPLWGIQYDPSQPDRHVSFLAFRDVTDRRLNIFGRMMAGLDLLEQVDCQNFACAHASAQPGNVISFPVERSDSGLDVLQTVRIMSEIEQLMRPLVGSTVAGGFQWDFDWEKPWLGAGGQLDENGTFRILLWGGLIRATKMSAPALEAIICHEFGHLLGGEPRQLFPVAGSNEREKHWSSAEGQSDWFAATVCLPRLYRSRGLSPAEVQSRIEQAGLGFMLFSQFHFEPHTSIPKLGAQASETPESTLTSTYPTLQCRLQTFQHGARCSEAVGNCTLRPRCWFVE